MTTLILALGNPLRGDDGIGAAVLEALPACHLT
jgi:hydrogenase maturation protease